MARRHLYQQLQQKPLPYNYHYYYAQNKINDFKKRNNMTLSQTSLYIYQQNDSKSNINDKIQSQTFNKIGQSSFKKSRKDDPQIKYSKSALFDSRQTRFELNNSPRSIFTQQEHLHSEEQEVQKHNKIQNSPRQQLRALQYEQYIKFIVDSYERQLNQYRKQIQKLRDTQEECIMLRQICLKHYEQCEKSSFKKI